jgi:hypothetical protein
MERITKFLKKQNRMTSSVYLFFFRLPKKTQSQWDVREERKKKKKVHGPSRATFGNIRIGKLVFLLRSSIFSPFFSSSSSSSLIPQLELTRVQVDVTDILFQFPQGRKEKKRNEIFIWE